MIEAALRREVARVHRQLAAAAAAVPASPGKARAALHKWDVAYSQVRWLGESYQHETLRPRGRGLPCRVGCKVSTSLAANSCQ